jgi:Tol biopolymer transport system component
MIRQMTGSESSIAHRRRSTRTTCLIAGILALCLAIVVPNAAQAAFPGANGRLAFSSHQIASIRPDGSDRRQLTRDTDFVPPEKATDPAFSPNGKRIAFSTDASELWMMRANGSHKRQLPGSGRDPAFAPSGNRIVFVDATGDPRDLFTMRLDGSHRRNLTNTAADEWGPEFSPDGKRIAFTSNSRRHRYGYSVHTMRADGTHRKQLLRGGSEHPSFSPDGKRIVFDNGIGAVYVMDRDGSDKDRLTNNSDTDPVFSPTGNRIAFCRGYSVATMRADGSFLGTKTRRGCERIDWQPRPR